MKKSQEHINWSFSWKRIKSYLKGERKGIAAHELEKEAENDIFLKEAMEGFELFQDDRQLDKDLHEIEDYVNYRKSQQAPKSNNRFYAVAASMTLLLSVSLWIWIQLNKSATTEELADKVETLESDESINFRSDEIKEVPEIYNSEEKAEPILSESEIVEKEVQNRSGQTMEDSEESSFLEKKESKSDAEFSISPIASDNSNQENVDRLIREILEKEKEFWLKEQNELTMAYQSAPQMASEAERILADEPKSKKLSKSRAETTMSDMAAGASSEDRSSFDTSANKNVVAFNPVTEIDEMLKTSYESLSQTRFVPDNSEFGIITGIKFLKQGDVDKGIEKLKHSPKRTPEIQQKIDSLILYMRD